MEEILELPEVEQTVRMLVERVGKSNVVPAHMLAEHLLRLGKNKEAEEETERLVCAWIDAKPHLGTSSPQAINTCRFLRKLCGFRTLRGESRPKNWCLRSMISLME